MDYNNSEVDESWNEFFTDEIDRERWQANFGKDAEAAESAAYYRDMVPGIEPSIASVYHKQGLNPYDINDWNEAGINDYKEVLNWHKAGAKPEVATAFKQKGLDHEAFTEWSKLGINNIDMLLHFSEDLKIDARAIAKFIKPLIDDKKIEIENVPAWIEAGIPPQEMGEWLNQGFKYPSVVAAWKQLKMNAETATEWVKVVTYPREAAKWLLGGYTNLEDIEGFIKNGYTSPEDIESELEEVTVKMK